MSILPSRLEDMTILQLLDYLGPLVGKADAAAHLARAKREAADEAAEEAASLAAHVATVQDCITKLHRLDGHDEDDASCEEDADEDEERRRQRRQAYAARRCFADAVAIVDVARDASCSLSDDDVTRAAYEARDAVDYYPRSRIF